MNAFERRLAGGIAVVALLGSWMVSLAQADSMPPLSRGEAVYIPVYSSVMHGNLNDNGKPSEILMSSMLSVRNTDPVDSIVLTSVRYYNTDGTMLRDHVTQPIRLGAMGSRDFFVEYKEREGGTGANFVVEWKAERAVNQPILETVQIYHWGTQSQAFVSRGQVLHPRQEEGRKKP